jgi:hypothetical protein
MQNVALTAIGSSPSVEHAVVAVVSLESDVHLIQENSNVKSTPANKGTTIKICRRQAAPQRKIKKRVPK